MQADGLQYNGVEAAQRGGKDALEGAIVTGRRQRHGLDTVMKFAAEGAKVVIADFNEQTGAAAVADGTAKGLMCHSSKPT